MNNKTLYFFIGTEAELIKLYPVFLEIQKLGFQYKVIASGQNDISGSPFLKLINGGKIDIDICDPAPIRKSFLGLIWWYIKTERRGVKLLKQYFTNSNLKDSFMIVHGDTVSTVMGSRLARKLKLNFGHIEAGYRSFNFLIPFPEEFDRYYSSIHSNINFAPGDGPTYNLRKNRGLTVNTKYNTVLETVHFALTEKHKSIITWPKPFFLFVFHRQENLLNPKMVRGVIEKIEELSKKINCVFIYHAYTKEILMKHGLFDRLASNKNIHMSPRVSYLDFIQTVSDAEFVITDGAGNQQEMFYLGKPCLLLRKKVEGSEGLGITTTLFENNLNKIVEFFDIYKTYKKELISPPVKPSKIIADSLVSYLSN